MGTILSRAEEPLDVQQTETERLEDPDSNNLEGAFGGNEVGSEEVLSSEKVPTNEENKGLPSERHAMNEANSEEVATSSESTSEVEEAARRRGREEELRLLKEELAAKRARRREALDSIRQELEAERRERIRLEALLEDCGGRAELEGLERQVRALKDVAKIGGEMLRIRELQVNELKEKLKTIEETGVAYEKEVENMRKLKALYEERSRAMAISHQMEVEREKARVVAAETRLEIAEEKNRELVEANKELQERISSLDSTVDKNNNEISELRIQLAGKKEELYNATSQITIVNSLFSQLLTDPESLDRVTRVLEEHHDLVNHLTVKGNINDVASVLMTVADKNHVLNDEEKCIATNLSKVWRLLVELLGHHNKQTQGEPMPESCYKSVNTPTGPKLVISVSQTFLRLKDLILEKNSLVKEVGRLKELNTHLEKRLISQESRLVEVAEELHKTWGVVTKLRTQHKAIHTHEQVLRYELKHKRLMLNELKQQLEECREMWQMARVKNNQTEKDWNVLRKEFADRKQQLSSAESGYEESPGDSQDEEDSHKMSDDEAYMQDFPASSSRCLTIRRIRDSELSTPDRSNTPDLQNSGMEDNDISQVNNSLNETETVSDLAQEVSNLETTNAKENVTPSFTTLHDESLEHQLTAISESEIKSENLAESTGGQTPSELVSVRVDDLSLESSVEILPWNDALEENTSVQSKMENCTATTGVAINLEAVSLEVEPQQDSDIENPVLLQSTTSTNGGPKSTAEEILARREARLKRLEEQCKSLFDKMSNTNKRSDIISNKLVELHEQYGEARGGPSTSENFDKQELNHTNTPTSLESIAHPKESNEDSINPLSEDPVEMNSQD